MSQFKERTINDQKLPLVIEPTNPNLSFDQFLRLLEEKNAYFKEVLLKHGGILFRNFPVANAQAFTETIKTLNTGKLVNYIGGGSPRVKVNESVYTSTEAPPAIKIPLHNEMSFIKQYPNHIYFYCDIPPGTGGETFIGDARKVYRDVSPLVREALESKKIKYISRYYHKSKFMDFINRIQRGHKTWIDVFETESKEEVEKKCLANEFAFRWNKHNWLEISRTRPCTQKHPKTEEPVWFNQIHCFDYNPKFIGWWRYLALKTFYVRKEYKNDDVTYGDGSTIPRKDIYHIMDVLDNNAIYFPWQKGDVMVLDNILTMHGRAPFTGKRRILAAMTKEGA
ncbi:MAG: TauD/TfdA family dioxygenase [Chlamydiales bacterium]